jgi:hypothetical protein
MSNEAKLRLRHARASIIQCAWGVKYQIALTVEFGGRRQAHQGNVKVNVPVERAVLRVVVEAGRLEALADAVKRLRNVQRAQVHRHTPRPEMFHTHNKSH